MLMEYFDNYARDHELYKNGNWCYEDGLVYRGLEMLHRQTGEARWLDHIVRLIDQQIGEAPSLAGYNPHDYNIDNIMPGRSLLYLDTVTRDPKYLEAAKLLITQLETHPRTKSGVYWHKLRYPWQVWLDGLYMGITFQAAYGVRTNQPALIEDAITQFDTALKMTFVPETGLYSHAMDEARKQPWANTTTGQSRAHWSRALGWLAMALVEMAETVGPKAFAPLKDRTEKFLSDIASLQQQNGLWLQVIDRADLKGNYEETSGSAMFVYALQKGTKLGLWNGDANVLTELLVKQSVIDTGGKVEMVGMCHVAGLGMYEDRFRDGSAEYYVSEKQCHDDPKGVSPLMSAVAEYIGNKQTQALSIGAAE